MKVRRKFPFQTHPGGNPVQSLPAAEPSAECLVPFAKSFSWPAAVFLFSGISALAYEIIWMMACILILPATLALGAFFPVVTNAYNKEQGEDQTKGSVGLLYFYNTIGGVIGSLAAGFWLVPALGIKSSISVAAGLTIAMAVAIYFAGVHSAWSKKAAIGSFAVTAFCLFVFASPGMDQTILNAGLYSEMMKKEYFSRTMIPENRELGNLLYFQEGINNSVAVVANKFNDGNLTLHLSGSWEASTEIHGRLHLKFLGHLPMLFARETKTVGVIGFGAGITTGTVLLYPDVQQVNVFELEPGVINARDYFAFVNNKPLEDSRTRLFMVDGRSHITYGNIRYDVITSDPIHPYVAGASNLYTLDYYQTMADHLNPGGVFCQWIPLVGMSPESFNIILNSMHQPFPHMAVFSFCGESVIIASKEPLRADWKLLENRFYDPTVYADLKMLDMMTPFNLVDFFMGGEAQIDRYLSGVTGINTDDNVWLEHRIPMDVFNLGRTNLFHMLQEKIPSDDRRSLELIFFGIPMEKLKTELSNLKKDGDNNYKRAQKARLQNDFESMEKYLRLTLADFNSIQVYPAGIQLMEYLLDSGRIDDIFPIASYLQRNFPAFPEAYIVEARAWEKTGKSDRAEQVLNRGWVYLPGNPKMLEWRRHFGIAG
jgi:spermidine synthase